MIDRQKQTKYTVSIDVARGAKWDWVTRVNVATWQGWTNRNLSAYTEAVTFNIHE